MKHLKVFLLALFAAIVVNVNAADESRIFKSKPYLQSLYNNGITVSWITNVPCYSWVEYGIDKNDLQAKHAVEDGIVIANNKENAIRLENLTPGATYYYRVCSKENKNYQAYSKTFGETAVSDIYSFKVPELNVKDFTIIVFNDIHRNNAVLEKLYNQVKDIDYDFSVFNGDDLNDCENDEGIVNEVSAITNIVKGYSKPILYVRGNHELRGSSALNIKNYVDRIGNKYYSGFSWGDTRFVILDLGEDKPDDSPVFGGLIDLKQYIADQSEFLKKEVKSKEFKKAQRRILIHHVPFYHNEDTYNPCAFYLDILKNAQIDIDLSGHTHTYKYWSKGKDQLFPAYIGGGPNENPESKNFGTVAILKKENKRLTLRVLKVDGSELLNVEL
ncbi:MAG: FN3 domain-containing metallophosphoesterase family protein [Bacteroidales bacterium]|nr:FN3 domain-containing metallophosphoesterase family protein [Bacteroidales bacterium]